MIAASRMPRKTMGKRRVLFLPRAKSALHTTQTGWCTNDAHPRPNPPKRRDRPREGDSSGRIPKTGRSISYQRWSCFRSTSSLIVHRAWFHTTSCTNPGNNNLAPLHIIRLAKPLPSLVIKCRVNGEPAVSVLGRCDVEDDFPVVHQPLVDLIKQGFKPDSFGQPQYRSQTR